MVGELTDRVAVITGGASGIGEACARIFAARGATVAIADLNLERANVVAKEIGGLGFEVDVADAAAKMSQMC
jgi:3-hydroxybutyrate dehydrogenase